MRDVRAVNTTLRPARELKPGDVVMSPFGRELIVEYVDVNDQSAINQEGSIPALGAHRPLGVTILYVGVPKRHGYRLDAMLEVKVDGD